MEIQQLQGRLSLAFLFIKYTSNCYFYVSNDNKKKILKQICLKVLRKRGQILSLLETVYTISVLK